MPILVTEVNLPRPAPPSPRAAVAVWSPPPPHQPHGQQHQEDQQAGCLGAHVVFSKPRQRDVTVPRRFGDLQPGAAFDSNPDNDPCTRVASQA
jgi:hypothetical protein